MQQSWPECRDGHKMYPQFYNHAYALLKFTNLLESLSSPMSTFVPKIKINTNIIIAMCLLGFLLDNEQFYMCAAVVSNGAVSYSRAHEA